VGTAVDVLTKPLPNGYDTTAEIGVAEAGHSIDVGLHWQHWRLPSAALDRVSDAMRTAARSALA
jgi:hypothetical protein